MALVQTPAAVHRDPHQIHLLEDDPESPDRALEDGGVGDVEDVSSLTQETSGFPCFRDPALAEPNVRPPGEAVRQVPDALAVAEENDASHGGSPCSVANAARPGYLPALPSALSIRRSWLYFAVRSVLDSDPVLI